MCFFPQNARRSPWNLRAKNRTTCVHNTQTCPGPISFSADFHWFIDFPRDGRNEISWYVLLKNMGARQRYHQGPKSIKSLYSPIFRYFDGTPDTIPIMNQGAEFTRNLEISVVFVCVAIMKVENSKWTPIHGKPCAMSAFNSSNPPTFGKMFHGNLWCFVFES